MLTYIRENAKMIAGALATILSMCLRPYIPVIDDPVLHAAIEVLLSVCIVAAAVWFTPNKPRDKDA